MQDTERKEKQRKEGRKRGGQISGVQVMFAAILSIGLILAINFSARIAAGQPLQEAYDHVSEEIVSLKQTQAQLTAERDYVLSDAYVDAWARSDGKMVLPGEVLVVPVPSGVETQATPEAQAPIQTTVQTTSAQNQPWTLWWQIFFDSPPPNLPFLSSNNPQQ